MSNIPETSLTPESLNRTPFVRELPADLETPVSVYLKLAGQGPAFLQESVTGGEQVARYSFIGVDIQEAYLLRNRTMEIHNSQGCTRHQIPAGQDPLDALRGVLSAVRFQAAPGLKRFSGGLAGYLGYESVQFFEPHLPLKPEEGTPEAIFLLVDTLVAFDHAYGRILLIANIQPEGDESAARRLGESRLDELEARLMRSLPSSSAPAISGQGRALRSNLSRAEYTAAVRAAKGHIQAGDIFQVVLSQRLTRPTTAAAFDIYRSLRRLNPSPYMFFFDFEGLAGEPSLKLIGASPEMHVRLEGRQAMVRPIAGTRRRGSSSAEDQILEAELLADPKELAEHVMLVDLARNDLGRVCDYGSVQVTESMAVERYSHVMHLVSQVEGRLGPGQDAFDLMRATFPAGTVSGAPKIRAMEIIHELERDARGPYAGAVGYFSYDGSMDTCITIRTLAMRGDQVSVQAGAGIVADSDPEREYQETLNKARALAVAVEMAENGRRLDESPVGFGLERR